MKSDKPNIKLILLELEALQGRLEIIMSKFKEYVKNEINDSR